jgi:CDP-glucose 4,6-dehydratase
METLVIQRAFWVGRRVFLTGHTGFKGAWISLLLKELGADVHGFALPPDDERNLFVTARVEQLVRHRVGDVRDLAALRTALAEARPSIVIHMAAQSLVRLSYAEPVETYGTNVLGTVHLLESVRRALEVESVVVVTSDKCYENVNSIWGYRENDRLGGDDPYSNSKACAELVVNAYRRSFFGDGAARVASARAGNVIGGGDWARDRLVPDAIRAFSAGEVLRIRNPYSVRPWQHVLEPVLGYLALAQRLTQDGPELAEGWNFGPTPSSEVPVERIADTLARLWGGSVSWEQERGQDPHEASCLKLDCAKAAARLGWRPLLDLDEALRLTVEWYRAFSAGHDMRDVTQAQIEQVLGADSLVSRPIAGTVAGVEGRQRWTGSLSAERCM